MKALRYYWEGFIGFLIRAVLASFLIGVLLALLVSYIHWSLGRKIVPPDIPLGKRGRLIFLLALLTLAVNLYLCSRR